jgi:peptide deformylase
MGGRIIKLELVDKKDPILLVKTIPWDFSNPPMDIVDFSQSLVDFMLEKNGIGLAANQVGYPYSIFAMRGSPENFVVINPKIVQPSEEMIELEESCLTFPNLILTIKRHRHIRVRFSAPDGQVYTKTFADMTARVFQHECCHLAGLPFWHSVSRTKFKMAVAKAKKKGYDHSKVTLSGKVF